jgi:adenine-specific DNA-methyltransferase
LEGERGLIGAALALGARDVPGWSKAESELARIVRPERPTRSLLAQLRRAIVEGSDPLGDAFCLLRSREQRRPMGATYTPPEIVTAMVGWAASEGRPARVIDPGIGSARFAVAAARKFQKAAILGVEVDPLAAILGRAHLAAAGFTDRARLELTDYRSFTVEPVDGRTLYLGNPPYVRHHQIETVWKEWLVRAAREQGHAASQLAGLHVYFFLATAMTGQPNDFGAFITSSEWLDVNYGALVREMLLDGLGGQSIHVLEPTCEPFEDAATTAAITCFRLDTQARSIRLRRVKNVDALGKLEHGQPVRRERLAEARRWTPLTRAARKIPEGYIELGELCRVHRGAVTGSNKTWVVDAAYADIPEAVLFPSVTRARELFAASTVLREVGHLRRVIDIPVDLDVFDGDDRRSIDRFLRAAKRDGAHTGYVAKNRRAWWSVGLRVAAPILATYMARRPPVFVRNTVQARHINIAHGLYPRQPIPAATLDKLAAYLCESVTLHGGRTYAGGLTKFEPREMERLPIPDLAVLTG